MEAALTGDSIRRGYLGLGSNVGDRIAALRDARRRLADEDAVRVVASSSAYETEPQGEVLEQPDFLNACLAIDTPLDPLRLLDVCKRIEAAQGREQAGLRHGPRSIDIDLLLLGDLVVEEQRLTLPHRDISTRRFVVEPLLELDPDLALPDGERVEALLEGVSGQRVSRTGPL